MNLEKLENGMIGIFNDGTEEYLTIFLENTFISFSAYGGRPMYDNKALEDVDDLQKVIKLTYKDYYCADLQFWVEDKKFLEYPHDVIWERKPKVEELTLEQVCKELGRDIKIVK